MKILVTGSAGFIGLHLVKNLVQRGDEVVGIDNLNDYYDVSLKLGRLNNAGISGSTIDEEKMVQSDKHSNYRFMKLNLTDNTKLQTLFKDEKFDAVCNLAAQAGVRYSIVNPQAYIDANIQGFFNVLECCRHNEIKHFIYASSSSVFGMNSKMPFSTTDTVDHPISLYAATKKSNELMAHTYSHLFNLPTTGLRFFTVYGPWGRPDMALFLFTKAIIEGKPIKVFNNGNMKRDFTYVEDIVDGIIKVIDNPVKGNINWNSHLPDSSSSTAPYKIYNIGNGDPVNLMDFVTEIEKNLNKNAIKDFMPMQDGDVVETWANIDDLQNDFNYKPKTSIKEGVKNFVDWYVNYYKS
ncbi:MAG: nucleoside-diphosphate-sugar epimerase [Sphingobacteriales bacterium]|nr:nucleoside-diphosphate-sugar epimerase [Sphingobacteriales bacterium]